MMQIYVASRVRWSESCLAGELARQCLQHLGREYRGRNNDLYYYVRKTFMYYLTGLFPLPIFSGI